MTYPPDHPYGRAGDTSDIGHKEKRSAPMSVIEEVVLAPTPGVWKKVAKAQAECDNAAKSKTNKQVGFKYAGLDDIFEAAKQAITENGLALVQAPIMVEAIDLRGTQMWRVHMANRLVDVDDGSLVEIVSYGDCSTAGLGDKAIGGATTYARKYGLCLLLGIATEDDTDQHSEPRREPFNPAEAKGSRYGKQKTLSAEAEDAKRLEEASRTEAEPAAAIPPALVEGVKKLLALRSKSSLALRDYTPEKFWTKSLVPLAARRAKKLDGEFISALIAESEKAEAAQ